MNEKASINPTFKILSAFGMIFIVTGHIPKGGGISLVYDWFTPYSFHIALFVFISGYFYNRASEDSVGGYIWRKTKKLMIPLYIINAAYGVFVWIMSFMGFEFGERMSLYNLTLMPLCTGQSAFGFNTAGWFVSTLFLTEVVNVLVRKLLGKSSTAKELILAAVYIAAGIAGVHLANMGYKTGIWLVVTRVMFFLACFAFGRIYKLYLEKYDDRIGNITYFLVLFAVQLLILIFSRNTSIYIVAWSNEYMNGAVVPFLTALTGTAFWLRVSKMLTPALKDSRAVRLVADNTYSIMMNHYLGFFVVNTLQLLFWKLTQLPNEFSVIEYATNYSYFYITDRVKQVGFIYLFAGIVIPVLMSVAAKKISERIKKVNYSRAAQ